MERSGNKPKNRLLKMAASAVIFQNQPFSPTREKRSAEISTNKLKAQARKGFSGPMIPMEARYKTRSSSYVAHEPTSPKVSCMGQIKHKKKILNSNKYRNDRPESLPPRDDHFISYSTPFNNIIDDGKKKASIFKSFQSFNEKKSNPAVLKPVQSLNRKEKNKNIEKKNSGIRNLFVKSSKKCDYEPPLTAPAHRSKPPTLGQFQRFTSGRNSLSDFDWTAAQISPAEDYQRDNYESDGESDVEEDVNIFFCAPIVMGEHNGVVLEPRKEINLWKRRTIAQPKPLQVKSQFG